MLKSSKDFSEPPHQHVKEAVHPLPPLLYSSSSSSPHSLFLLLPPLALLVATTSRCFLVTRLLLLLSSVFILQHVCAPIKDGISTGSGGPQMQPPYALKGRHQHRQASLMNHTRGTPHTEAYCRYVVRTHLLVLTPLLALVFAIALLVVLKREGG